MEKSCCNLSIKFFFTVISTHAEPIEGWIDNVFGPTGGVVGAGAGLIRTMNIDSECAAELVPVDMTVNALIATAWEVSKNKYVVNCTYQTF